MTAIHRKSLVLNRHWQPINVASVPRALSMLFSESAHAVDGNYQLYDWDSWLELPPGDHYVTSPRFKVRAPDAIVTQFDTVPSSVVTFSRRNVFKRDHYTCQYCHCQPGTEELTIDHVLPRSMGGISRWENCVLACLECNRRKADRTPEAASMRLRKAPKKPIWVPLYSEYLDDMPSWKNFISEAYWKAELEE